MMKVIMVMIVVVMIVIMMVMVHFILELIESVLGKRGSTKSVHLLSIVN